MLWTLVQRRKKKSGTPNKKKTFYALVTFTGESPIKTTAMSMLDQHLILSNTSREVCT